MANGECFTANQGESSLNEFHTTTDTGNTNGDSNKQVKKNIDFSKGTQFVSVFFRKETVSGSIILEKRDPIHAKLLLISMYQFRYSYLFTVLIEKVSFFFFIFAKSFSTNFPQISISEDPGFVSVFFSRISRSRNLVWIRYFLKNLVRYITRSI